jgi:VanZ family protein
VIENLQRAFLALAIPLTIVYLGASVMPSAGRTFSGEWHWSAHVFAFVILAIAWRGALPRVPALVVTLAVIGFGFVQEAIEMVGHAHAFEWRDAIVDTMGVIIGMLLVSLLVSHANRW